MSSNDYFDPEKAEIEWSYEENKILTRPRYMNSPLMEDSVKVAKKLELDMDKYRSRMVRYIPFSYQRNVLLDHITHLDRDDVEFILNAYDKNTDTERPWLRELHKYAYIEFLQKYESDFHDKKNHALAVLKQLIEENTHSVGIY